MKKTLLITGASKGIGLATAERFARDGYDVMNLSRSAPPLTEIRHLPFDLGAREWPEADIHEIKDFCAGSDRLVLIHNAAKLESDSVMNVDVQALRDTLELNVVAVSRLNQLLIGEMGMGSSILYVGSTLGEKAVANACSYVVSKHALIGLMRATCQDLLGTGIHTACICPGFTDTAMLRSHVGQDEDVLTGIASGVTFNRLIEPEEIAEALHFCAASPVINGSVIHANLGQIER